MIVSRDGWVKRQKEVRDLSTTRLREGDSVLAVLPGSTRATVVFFTNLGAAYTSRIIDVPASTGYGEPVQKLFKLRDQERVIAAVSLDPRVAGEITPKKEGAVPRVHAIAVTSDGYSLRFGLDSFVEPSTRAGRRYARPSEGVEVVGVAKISGDEIVIAATEEARAILCRADEVNYLSGPGKGVILIKLGDKDRVLGFIASTGDRDIMRVETSRGAEQTISTTKYEVTGRGGKGRELLQRGQFTRVIPTSRDVETPPPAAQSRVTRHRMILAAGTRLGQYEVLAPLGSGGMGEVFRARDTKLGRDVALKVLPDAFTLDRERIARFKREAQVLASLNHPNIAAIYGIEDSTNVHALVLELVEGQTLADRIAQGPVPLGEAIAIADQIADALEAAHERGVIHRDLKPANIALRPDGTVKVLDFGLAKALEGAPGSSDPSLSPTITTPAMTHDGHDPGDSGVHESGTGAREAGRSSRRCLGVRRGALRDAHWPAASSLVRRSPTRWPLCSRRSHRGMRCHKRRRRVFAVCSAVASRRTRSAGCKPSAIDDCWLTIRSNPQRLVGRRASPSSPSQWRPCWRSRSSR